MRHFGRPRLLWASFGFTLAVSGCIFVCGLSRLSSEMSQAFQGSSFECFRSNGMAYPFPWEGHRVSLGIPGICFQDSQGLAHPFSLVSVVGNSWDVYGGYSPHYPVKGDAITFFPKSLRVPKYPWEFCRKVSGSRL